MGWGSWDMKVEARCVEKQVSEPVCRQASQAQGAPDGKDSGWVPLQRGV